MEESVSRKRPEMYEQFQQLLLECVEAEGYTPEEFEAGAKQIMRTVCRSLGIRQGELKYAPPETWQRIVEALKSRPRPLNGEFLD